MFAIREIWNVSNEVELDRCRSEKEIFMDIKFQPSIHPSIHTFNVSILWFSIDLPILKTNQNRMVCLCVWLSFYCILDSGQWNAHVVLFHCYCSQIISICIDKYDLRGVFENEKKICEDSCCLPREIVNDVAREIVYNCTINFLFTNTGKLTGFFKWCAQFIILFFLLVRR